MNTDKVFTAFNKEGEEILLFRKDNDTYIDLNSDNNEIYPKENIDLKTLIHASKSLNLRHHMLESSIKRKYNKDRNKLIYAKDILFGIEYTITNLKEFKTDSGWRLYGVPQYNYHYKWDNDESEYLNLYEFKREVLINDYIYNVYINLFDKKEYIVFKENTKDLCKLPSFGEGMKFIYANGLSLEDAIEESVLEKKKIFEYANETRKQKITE